MTQLLAPLAAAATLMTLVGCASYPLPVQHLADAEGAARSAQDTGAASNPQAQLHLKLAQEELAQAQQLIKNGDNQRADSVLMRAKADAELALGEAREQVAQGNAVNAAQKLGEVSNGSPPAASVTTTSSATTTNPNSAPSSAITTTTTTTGGKP